MWNILCVWEQYFSFFPHLSKSVCKSAFKKRNERGFLLGINWIIWQFVYTVIWIHQHWDKLCLLLCRLQKQWCGKIYSSLFRWADLLCNLELTLQVLTLHITSAKLNNIEWKLYLIKKNMRTIKVIIISNILGKNL